MKVTVKGQVTIPADMRRRYGIGPDTEVEFRPTKEGILLTTAENAQERFDRWIERAKGSATTGLTTDEIMQMTRGED
jgi:antitoxin PrlF